MIEKKLVDATLSINGQRIPYALSKTVIKSGAEILEFSPTFGNPGMRRNHGKVTTKIEHELWSFPPVPLNESEIDGECELDAGGTIYGLCGKITIRRRGGMPECWLIAAEGNQPVSVTERR